MIPTKYAIKCSTEEQAIECNIKQLKSWISPDIIHFYRNKWYTIISYAEAKEKWLLGDISKKETTDELIEKMKEIFISFHWTQAEERGAERIYNYIMSEIKSLKQTPTSPAVNGVDGLVEKYSKSQWIVNVRELISDLKSLTQSYEQKQVRCYRCNCECWWHNIKYEYKFCPDCWWKIIFE